MRLTESGRNESMTSRHGTKPSVSRCWLSRIIAAAVMATLFGGIPPHPNLPPATVEAAPKVTYYYAVYVYNRRYPSQRSYYGSYASEAEARRVISQISSSVYAAYYTRVAR